MYVIRHDAVIVYFHPLVMIRDCENGSFNGFSCVRKWKANERADTIRPYIFGSKADRILHSALPPKQVSPWIRTYRDKVYTILRVIETLQTVLFSYWICQLIVKILHCSILDCGRMISAPTE